VKGWISIHKMNVRIGYGVTRLNYSWLLRRSPGSLFRKPLPMTRPPHLLLSPILEWYLRPENTTRRPSRASRKTLRKATTLGHDCLDPLLPAPQILPSSIVVTETDDAPHRNNQLHDTNHHALQALDGSYDKVLCADRSSRSTNVHCRREKHKQGKRGRACLSLQRATLTGEVIT
jgi:hypothetical protein